MGESRKPLLYSGYGGPKSRHFHGYGLGAIANLLSVATCSKECGIIIVTAALNGKVFQMEKY